MDDEMDGKIGILLFSKETKNFNTFYPPHSEDGPFRRKGNREKTKDKNRGNRFVTGGNVDD